MSVTTESLNVTLSSKPEDDQVSDDFALVMLRIQTDKDFHLLYAAATVAGKSMAEIDEILDACERIASILGRSKTEIVCAVRPYVMQEQLK